MNQFEGDVLIRPGARFLVRNVDDETLLAYRYTLGDPNGVIDEPVGSLASGPSGVWQSTGPFTWIQIGSGIQSSMRLDDVVRTPQIDGQQSAMLPFGSYVRADPDDMTVELSTNGGASWSTLVFGADWIFTPRRAGAAPASGGVWPQPSTANVSSGAWLTAPLSMGDLVRLTWRTGVVQAPPPEPISIRALAGSIDPTPDSTWRYNAGPASWPNAVVLSARAGLAIEMWRMSPRGPHTRLIDVGGNLPGFVIQSAGRQYSPYYRFPTSLSAANLVCQPSILGLSENPHQQTFRFCYYDPTTGARSPLSASSMRWQSIHGDVIRGVLIHPAGSVWVSRS